MFEVRDDQAHVLIESPPARLMEKVKWAIRLGPRQAISLREKYRTGLVRDYASTGR